VQHTTEKAVCRNEEVLVVFEDCFTILFIKVDVVVHLLIHGAVHVSAIKE
jgi:hypothetical protein